MESNVRTVLNAHKEVATILKLFKNFITLIYQNFANTMLAISSYQSNLIISLEPQKRFETIP